MNDEVLYCIVLYCIVLYCIALYCIVLYCIVSYCIGSIFHIIQLVDICIMANDTYTYIQVYHMLLVMSICSKRSVLYFMLSTLFDIHLSCFLSSD